MLHTLPKRIAFPSVFGGIDNGYGGNCLLQQLKIRLRHHLGRTVIY